MQPGVTLVVTLTVDFEIFISMNTTTGSNTAEWLSERKGAFEATSEKDFGWCEYPHSNKKNDSVNNRIYIISVCIIQVHRDAITEGVEWNHRPENHQPFISIGLQTSRMTRAKRRVMEE